MELADKTFLSVLALAIGSSSPVSAFIGVLSLHFYDEFKCFYRV